METTAVIRIERAMPPAASMAKITQKGVEGVNTTQLAMASAVSTAVMLSARRKPILRSAWLAIDLSSRSPPL